MPYRIDVRRARNPPPRRNWSRSISRWAAFVHTTHFPSVWRTSSQSWKSTPDRCCAIRSFRNAPSCRSTRRSPGVRCRRCGWRRAAARASRRSRKCPRRSRCSRIRRRCSGTCAARRSNSSGRRRAFARWSSFRRTVSSQADICWAAGWRSAEGSDLTDAHRKSTNVKIDQSINGPINQSINLPINRVINQSTNQSIWTSYNTELTFGGFADVSLFGRAVHVAPATGTLEIWSEFDAIVL